MRAATRLVHELPAPSAPYWIGQGRYQRAWNNLERDMKVLIGLRARPAFFNPSQVLAAFKTLKRAYRSPRTAHATLLANDAFMKYWRRTTDTSELPRDATDIVDQFLEGYDAFHDLYRMPGQPSLRDPALRSSTLANVGRQRAARHQNQAAQARRQAAARQRRVAARQARRTAAA